MLAQGKKRKFPWNCGSEAIGTVWLLGFTRRNCGSQKRLLWPYLAREQLVLLFGYGGHLQGKHMLGRIWNCTLAALALLHVSFPTSSPSRDQVLQTFQQIFCISGPEIEVMSENSLKVPCLLQAWAASQGWMHLCKSALGRLEVIRDCQGAEHDLFASLTCIPPHPPALHVLPVRQERARQRCPHTSVWSCLLLVQQEMLWDLCSTS